MGTLGQIKLYEKHKPKDGDKRYKHGYARVNKIHKLYGIWKSMKVRCYNEYRPQYKAHKYKSSKLTNNNLCLHTLMYMTVIFVFSWLIKSKAVLHSFF